MRTSSPSLLSEAVPIALADSSAFSLGFVRMSHSRVREMRLSPLHRRAREPSTPATTAGRRFGSEGATLRVPFRPRGFSPPRRLPPLHEARACCIPLPILGSIAFPLETSRSEDRDLLCFPAMQVSYPSKESSPPAVTRHRAPCPLAVRFPTAAAPPLDPVAGASFFAVGGSGASASRPCSVVESGEVPAVAGEWTTRSFLGFVPLQGPSSRPEIPSPTAPLRARSSRSPWRIVVKSELRSARPRSRNFESAPSRAGARSGGDHARELVSGFLPRHDDPKTVAISGQRVAMRPKPYRRGAS